MLLRGGSTVVEIAPGHQSSTNNVGRKLAPAAPPHRPVVCQNSIRDWTICERREIRHEGCEGRFDGEWASRISRDQVVDLWDRVVFTNYIQKVFKSDRVRPSAEDWPAGRAALSEELAKHRPDVIIVMGLDLASHLKWLPEVAPDVTVAAIAHPSSFRFTYAKWVPRVKEAFASPSAGVA